MTASVSRRTTSAALTAPSDSRSCRSSFLVPEIEWVAPGTAPWCGEGRGVEYVQRFFQTFGTTATLKTFEPRSFFADGDQVVVLGYEEGASNTTGRG